ncbi:hypothetical protein C2845_PM16G19280 [Panicum miliaceum]|uniref:DUF1618 domain-containing protein n=1 Tax=Panicum miliaceum TaxID=4540 RepID=A0A3L6PYZ9_PANMI|nr:hypothetical protein C2845_PM16G19280 [Panicum miliaceum]
MSAAAFPNWVILEPFVFRRGDDDSFPDESKAPVRAYGTTSWGTPFRIAFSFAEPPRVSRLYAQLPDFPDPKKQTPLAILATHRHLALLCVGTELIKFVTVQDFFIYSAYNPSSLQRLPPCSEPYMDSSGCQPRGHLLPYPKDHEGVGRCMLAVRSMGILCRGEGEQEFAVAELKLLASRNKVHADIWFLKSAAPGIGCKWSFMRVPVLHSNNPKEQLCFWQTDTVIPIDRWLCWIDYSQGILFCDVFGEPKPTVSFLRFPPDKFPDTYSRSITCNRS